MTQLAKWAWFFFLASLFIGPWVFAVIGLSAMAFLLIYWFKPHWLDHM